MMDMKKDNVMPATKSSGTSIALHLVHGTSYAPAQKPRCEDVRGIQDPSIMKIHDRQMREHPRSNGRFISLKPRLLISMRSNSLLSLQDRGPARSEIENTMGWIAVQSQIMKEPVSGVS